MNVIVAVPRRSDGGHRDAVWAWVKARWESEHPDWQIVEGEHTDGPFNRSAAINTAAKAGGGWDVMVIADADTIVDPNQIEQAVRTAAETGQATYAFEHFCYLNQTMTDRILDGFTGNWWIGVEWTLTNTVSSMVAVPRKLWKDCRGADEGFVGWGGEDVAMSIMFDTLGGGHQRTAGHVWHLWHETAPRDKDDSWADRLKLYSAVEGKKTKMRALIRQLRSELAAQ